MTPSGEPDKSAFRNTTLVLAEAKTIHNNGDVGNKYVTPSGDPDKSAFRTTSLVLPEPKSIYGIEDTGNKFLQPSGDPDKNAYRCCYNCFSISFHMFDTRSQMQNLFDIINCFRIGLHSWSSQKRRQSTVKLTQGTSSFR